MHWLSLVIIVVFGGATLMLQDKMFIKWKPTVLYGLFGVILAVGRLGFGRDLLGYLMPGVALPQPVWPRLTWAWVAFFVVHGLRQLVRRVRLLRTDLGQLQGLGRHRTLPHVRVGARASGSRVMPTEENAMNGGSTAARVGARAGWPRSRRTVLLKVRRQQRRASRARRRRGRRRALFADYRVGGVFRPVAAGPSPRVLREVGDLVPYPIHALSIKALAPEEFPSQTPKESSMMNQHFDPILAATAGVRRARGTPAQARDKAAPAKSQAAPAAAATPAARRQGAL